MVLKKRKGTKICAILELTVCVQTTLLSSADNELYGSQNRFARQISVPIRDSLYAYLIRTNPGERKMYFHCNKSAIPKDDPVTLRSKAETNHSSLIQQRERAGLITVGEPYQAIQNRSTSNLNYFGTGVHKHKRIFLSSGMSPTKDQPVSRGARSSHPVDIETRRVLLPREDTSFSPR